MLFCQTLLIGCARNNNFKFKYNFAEKKISLSFILFFVSIMPTGKHLRTIFPACTVFPFLSHSRCDIKATISLTHFARSCRDFIILFSLLLMLLFALQLLPCESRNFLFHELCVRESFMYINRFYTL
jgi:hypothetical protein